MHRHFLIKENRLYGLAGNYGSPSVDEPVEYDKIVITQYPVVLNITIGGYPSSSNSPSVLSRTIFYLTDGCIRSVFFYTQKEIYGNTV